MTVVIQPISGTQSVDKDTFPGTVNWRSWDNYRQFLAGEVRFRPTSLEMWYGGSEWNWGWADFHIRLENSGGTAVAAGVVRRYWGQPSANPSFGWVPAGWYHLNTRLVALSTPNGVLNYAGSWGAQMTYNRP